MLLHMFVQVGPLRAFKHSPLYKLCTILDA